VRIRSGVFEGVEGMVTEFRRSSRVVIALAAIRQRFSVEVDLQDIEVLRKTTNGSEIRSELSAVGMPV
jgi:transcription antitermination factor NusG